jgi:hypothetical protein
MYFEKLKSETEITEIVATEQEFEEKDYKSKEIMFLDFFSATFNALRTKNKKKYKLLTEDQVSYFFESLLIVAIQIILCFTILSSGQLKPQLSYEYDV